MAESCIENNPAWIDNVEKHLASFPFQKSRQLGYLYTRKPAIQQFAHWVIAPAIIDRYHDFINPVQTRQLEQGALKLDDAVVWNGGVITLNCNESNEFEGALVRPASQTKNPTCEPP
jgi:hypothetical protein